MLSIEQIKIAIDTLKKLKNENWQDFIDQYLKKLEDLAIQVDAYNTQQIAKLDKTTDWYAKDLNWRDNHKDTIHDKMLIKTIESKIFQFAKTGNTKQNSLEIGPGHGKFSKMFLSWQINFFLDVLPHCQSKIHKLFNPKHHKYLRFYTTDRTKCEKIPTNSCSFVFSWDTFPFFTQKHIDEYLKDLYRVILPGGYCFIQYADCSFEKDLHEAKRGYWNYNTKSAMKELIETTGYKVIEMDQFKPGANYAIFQKPGDLNPVVYKVTEPPAYWFIDRKYGTDQRRGKEKRYGKKKK